jgi:hypothetical protein
MINTIRPAVPIRAMMISFYPVTHSTDLGGRKYFDTE